MQLSADSVNFFSLVISINSAPTLRNVFICPPPLLPDDMVVRPLTLKKYIFAIKRVLYLDGNKSVEKRN
jgi:hypothetical protein